MIGDKFDIHCEGCGRYLFTVEEVPYDNRDGFLLGKEVRINDFKNYIYTNEGRFICDKCTEEKLCTVM